MLYLANIYISDCYHHYIVNNLLMTDSLYIIPMHYNRNVLLTTNHIVYAFQCRAF